jgi:hypothetical protein
LDGTGCGPTTELESEPLLSKATTVPKRCILETRPIVSNRKVLFPAQNKDFAHATLNGYPSSRVKWKGPRLEYTRFKSERVVDIN